MADASQNPSAAPSKAPDSASNQSSNQPASLSNRLAERAEIVQPFRVMELSKRAFEYERLGHEVVHFQVGEPDFSTCEPIVAAGQAALTAGQTKYTNADGLLSLREAIAGYYGDHLGQKIDPDDIMVTSGASGALTLLLAALFNPGDEMLMADPGYPCNAAFAHMVNALPRLIPATAANEYQLTGEQVRKAWRENSRGVLLASPANPTGGMLSASALRGICAAVAEHRGVVMLDEIYSGLVFEERSDSYKCGWEIDRDIFLVNSFSKFFGMTGWRLGWIVTPQWAKEPLERFAQNLFISPSTPAQYAAIAAFSSEAMAIHEERRDVFRERRDLLAGGLSQLGFGLPFVPGGGFFLYVDVSRTGMDAETFCWRLVDEYKVAVTPGTDFGTVGAAQHVRFAFTTSTERIELGLERIRQALSDWGVGGAL